MSANQSHESESVKRAKRNNALLRLEAEKAQIDLKHLKQTYNIADYTLCCNCAHNPVQLKKWLHQHYHIDTNTTNLDDTFCCYNVQTDSKENTPKVKVQTLMNIHTYKHGRQISASPHEQHVRSQLQLEQLLNKGGATTHKVLESELTWFCMHAVGSLEQYVHATENCTTNEKKDSAAIAVAQANLWNCLRSILGDLTVSNIEAGAHMNQNDYCRWDVHAASELKRHRRAPSATPVLQRNGRFVQVFERTANIKTMPLPAGYTFNIMRNVSVPDANQTKPAPPARHGAGGDVVTIILLALLVSFVAYSYYQCATGRFMKKTKKHKTKMFLRTLMCVAPILFPFPGIIGVASGLFSALGGGQIVATASAIVSPILATPIFASVGEIGQTVWTTVQPVVEPAAGQISQVATSAADAASPIISPVSQIGDQIVDTISSGEVSGQIASAATPVAADIGAEAGTQAVGALTGQSGGGTRVKAFTSLLMGKVHTLFRKFYGFNKMHVQWVHYETDHAASLIRFRRVVQKTQYTHELTLPFAYFMSRPSDPNYFMNQFYLSYFHYLRVMSAKEDDFKSFLHKHKATIREGLKPPPGHTLSTSEMDSIISQRVESLMQNREVVNKTILSIPDFVELLHADPFLTPSSLLQKYCACVTPTSKVTLQNNSRCREIVGMLNLNHSLERMGWLETDQNKRCFTCKHIRQEGGGRRGTRRGTRRGSRTRLSPVRN